jgi:NADPH:quinone reductase-like Zn-dependent oxidoreductase
MTILPRRVNVQAAVFQEIVDAVQDGRLRVNVNRTFEMTEIAEAHRYMEANRAAGKVVVLTPAE